MTEFGEDKTIVDRLNDLHHDLCSDVEGLSDFAKIVRILDALDDKIEDLRDHNHLIS